MKKKTILLFVPVIFAIAVAIVPLICFAATGWWPSNHSAGMGITFWILYGLGLLTTVIWCVASGIKNKETGITYLQLCWVVFLQFLAPITLLFAIANNFEWIFAIPLSLSVLIYIAFIIVVLISGVASDRMKATLQKTKSEQAPVVDADKTFNNEDGTFKGSRVKVNKDK